MFRFNRLSSSSRAIAGGAPVVAEVSLSERLAFIRKVYSLLALSLFFGIVAGAFTMNSPEFLLFVVNNMMIFFIAEIGFLIAANFVKKESSLSFIMMNAFTVLTGITTAPIVYVYKDVALQAALTTVAIFLGLTFYTFVSKKDFSFLGGMLTVSIIAMVVLGLLNAFWFQSGITQLFLSGVGVLVFSGFILYETSNIMRVYPTNMAVQASLALYISILNLFISLLQIFGGGRR
ncbi:MAG: Bax inhibitor-1 family protein [SAR324 cluster bacterium]|nr:Bax inhibitor-1 family protein [SAR324 cluster bacterium]